ncbi:TolC family outer membrane protein [Rhodoferax antarcticus]|uniref:TolC family outer membrane protein n=1 Tax=Rhodoferax antarcticus TaxID=81479 RepID=UPI0022245B79|nr:TolC family outer membrane protein [Rhodoferax antarcticus]MCW2313976.1 outer membrane protein/protease secretion system outer membrane protein [Rhodoferax antarcticus]
MYLQHLCLPVRRPPFKALLLSAMMASGLTANAMDLLQAFDAAQQSDASILSARATTQAERERLPQAKSQMLPSLNASVSSMKNQLESETPNFLGVTQTTHTDYPSTNKSVTLRQPLYRPQLLAQYRQAQSLVDDAEAVLMQEEQNLAVRVAGAYFDALLAHEQLSLILAQQAAYAKQLDASKKSFAAGSGIRTDIDEAQARLDMNLAQEIEARQNVSYTLQQLQMLVKQPIEKLAELNASKLELLSPQPDNLQDWVTRAEANSPQLRSLKARVDAARQETEKAKSGHYPTIDAIVQWSDSKSESVTNTSSRYINKSYGLQLNVPLFAGGYVNSLVRQALASQTRAEQNLEAGRLDLSLRVYKEFRGVTENIPKVKALEQALRSADQMIISSRKSFQAGSRTMLEVLNAEQQRTVVLRDLAQARFMYLISKIRLLALVGGADRGVVEQVNLVLATPAMPVSSTPLTAKQ